MFYITGNPTAASSAGLDRCGLLLKMITSWESGWRVGMGDRAADLIGTGFSFRALLYGITLHMDLVTCGIQRA
jgi:hypothetical protein